MTEIEELKTVKDLNQYVVNNCIDRRDLKEEVMKWIRELNVTGSFCDCKIGGFEFGNFHLDNSQCPNCGLNHLESNATTLVRFLKYLHNITEKELEGGKEINGKNSNRR